MCLCLRQEFKILVSRDSVLDLQASTEKKFSRHLIFLFKNAAFKNNIHAGRYIYAFSIFVQLPKDLTIQKLWYLSSLQLVFLPGCTL